MLWHTSPTAIYVKSDRDLSHIELERSDNISSSSKARTYRVGGVDISTEEKREQEYKEKILIFLLSFCLYMGLGLAHYAFDQSNAMLAVSGIFKFSVKNITHYVLCPLFLKSTASASTKANLFCRYASHARLDIFALRQIRYVFASLKLDMI